MSKTKTTVKQTRPLSRRAVALTKIAENGGNVSKALREANYSDEYAKNPQKFKKTKAYTELIERYLPDEMLLERHNEIINAPRIKRTYLKGTLMEETEETDPSQVRGLDMAYKLKGKYTDTVTNNILIVQLSDTSAVRYKPAEQHGNDSP